MKLCLFGWRGGGKLYQKDENKEKRGLLWQSHKEILGTITLKYCLPIGQNLSHD